LPRRASRHLDIVRRAERWAYVARFAPAALAVLAATVAPVRVALGQVMRLPGSGEPAYWTSLSAGLFQTQAVLDGRTQTVWDFGQGVQYRASIEQAIGNQSSIGVTGTYARLPLTFTELAPATDVSSCGGGCDAHADVTSLTGSFHAGGGQGFHQVIDLAVGVTRFAHFRADDTDRRLGPDGDTDFSFMVGYGFGYSLSPRTQIVLVQEYGSAFHQGDGLRGSDRRMNQQYTTRLGARFGIGTRSR
jgi:hypothetical protein